MSEYMVILALVTAAMAAIIALGYAIERNN